MQGTDSYLTEKVDPVFRGSEQDTAQRWISEIPPLAKATAALLAAIIAIGAPSVWWISRLDTNVDNLKTVVAEIRVRTEDMFRVSVQQGGRIDNLEKSIDVIRAPSISQTQTAPPQQAGSRAK